MRRPAFAAALGNDGRYAIENIPQGRYVATVEADGVKPRFRSPGESPLRVEIKPGENPLDFSLD